LKRRKEVASNGALAYGAFELKKSYQKNLSKGFLIAALLHITIIGSFLLYNVITSREPTAEIRVIKSLAELGPPPTLTQQEKPQLVIAMPQVAPPSVGVPKPVPDEEIVEVKMVTQKQLQEVAPAPVQESGEEVAINIPMEELFPRRGEFVPVEVQPQVISKVQPVYPELARKAQVEGTVYLDLLVDKEGKVRRVEIVKPSGSTVGFEEAAVEAAEQWTFSPAIQNGEPVAVWMTLPIRFEVK
jgi:protein TonB